MKEFWVAMSLFGFWLSGFGAGMAVNGWRYQASVIERGMGLYCPDTGAFAFVGECGK